VLDGALVNVTELNRLVGIPGNIVTLLAGKENSLGNPPVDGYVPSKSTAGVVTWIPPASGSALGFKVDSLINLDGEAAFYDSDEAIPPHVPAGYRDDAATLFPTIQSAAGDTSNYNTPDKIGDLYIDTSAGKVYVSIAAARGGWRILNYILPLFISWNIKRRRRK
jgi:hypothetical protein